MRRFIHWTPRVLTVAFALFLSLFALDVFNEFSTFNEVVVALVMHLRPTFVLLVALIIAWRWPLVGGVVFVALSAFSVMYFNTYRQLITFLMISIPAFVIGVLFLWDAWQRRHGAGLNVAGHGA